jgi:hypothetical protein
MDQSRYTKSLVTILFEAADIKKSNMPHGNILATSFINTYKAFTTMPEEPSQIQEACNLDYASYIGSPI